jgi:hypothetical protein
MIDRINIEIIPKEKQRPGWEYGDYWLDGRTLEIRISRYANFLFTIFLAVHELLEAVRCILRGVTMKEIDDFDLTHQNAEDPGQLPNAPYHVEHMQSMEVERLLCEQEGYDFEEYYGAEPIENLDNSVHSCFQ